MPNLSELIVSQGIRFTDFHAEVPLCGPSRANLLTGQHAHNSGANSNDGQQLDPATTIATELDEAGYHTSYVGKYLNGYRAFPPDRRDPPGWDSFDVIDSNQGKYFWYEMRDREGGITQHRTDEADYSTDVIADLAVQRIREAPADEPALRAHLALHAARAQPAGAAPRGRPALRGHRALGAAQLRRGRRLGQAALHRRRRRRSATAASTSPPTARALLAVDELIGRVGDELRAPGSPRRHRLRLHRRQRHDLGRAPPGGQGLAVQHGRAGLRRLAGRRGAGAPGRRHDPEHDRLGAHVLRAGRLRDGTLSQRPGAPRWAQLRRAADRRALPVRATSILHTIPSGGDRPVFWSLRTTADHPDGRWLYVENLDGFRELYDISGGPCYEWQAGGAGRPLPAGEPAGGRAATRRPWRWPTSSAPSSPR